MCSAKASQGNPASPSTSDKSGSGAWAGEMLRMALGAVEGRALPRPGLESQPRGICPLSAAARSLLRLHGAGRLAQGSQPFCDSLHGPRGTAKETGD